MKKPLKISDVESLPCWARLTTQQRLFCKICVEASDPTFAYQQAYSANSTEQARVKSYSILAHPNVRAVLNILYGKTKKELALDECDRVLRSKKADAASKQAAQALKLKLLSPR